MKTKIIITLCAFLTFGSAALAQEEPNEDRATNFTQHKTDMIANINEEKSLLDQVASCVNSAQKPEDLRKCQDVKKSGMQKIQAKMLQKRKQHLTNELKKLDEKEAKSMAK